ncbi:MAG: ParB/RepB/Spo0J family partition protein [Rickettsiaceae bacterium]|nr:ParB/RepB/Spo0J family partition protein [Rickettsiaceae bacterium]
MKNKGLGRGLSALITQNKESHDNQGLRDSMEIDIQAIEPNKFQPRKTFDDNSIVELAESISRHGIIQPLIVRKDKNSEKYQIVAGERRWRAALISGLEKIPVIIRDIDDKTLAEQAIIENIQRENLNPIEEASAYLDLIDKYNYTQGTLASSLGKSRSHVANMLRIHSLPDIVKKYLTEGKLTFGHAKVIAGHTHAEKIANEIISKNLSVRRAEELIKKTELAASTTQKPNSPLQIKSNDDIKIIEETLSKAISAKVSIENKGKSGKIIIKYDDLLELDDIISKLVERA